MPSVSFRYTQNAVTPSDAFPEGQRVLRPQLRAVVSVPPGQGVGCMVCLDTGADRCTFPLSFANRLGLDPTTMPKDVVRGATGPGDIYYADVRISVPFTMDEKRCDLTVNTRAGFTSGMDAQGLGLLGQIGFFDAYTVTFNQGQNAFTIYF